MHDDASGWTRRRWGTLDRRSRRCWRGLVISWSGVRVSPGSPSSAVQTPLGAAWQRRRPRCFRANERIDRLTNRHRPPRHVQRTQTQTTPPLASVKHTAREPQAFVLNMSLQSASPVQMQPHGAQAKPSRPAPAPALSALATAWICFLSRVSPSFMIGRSARGRFVATSHLLYAEGR